MFNCESSITHNNITNWFALQMRKREQRKADSETYHITAIFTLFVDVLLQLKRFTSILLDLVPHFFCRVVSVTYFADCDAGLGYQTHYIYNATHCSYRQ